MVALADLALTEGQGHVSLVEISKRQSISLSYLEQLFLKLRRAGIVEAVRGAGGGYRLAKPIGQISVRDVLIAVDEEINAMNLGGNTKGGTSGTKAQSLSNRLWESLSAQLYVFTHKISLADVVDNQLTPCPAVPGILRSADE